MALITAVKAHVISTGTGFPLVLMLNYQATGVNERSRVFLFGLR